MVSESIRKTIRVMCEKHLSKFPIWDHIETDIIPACAKLTEPINDKGTKKLVEELHQLKELLKSKDVRTEHLGFLVEEIEQLEQTQTMSLFVEDEDFIEDEIIDRYARLGAQTEGIMGIHHDFNYSQLSRLTNEVFRRTGMIKFYISKERTVYGKIIAEVDEYGKKLPIAQIIESKRVNKETQEPTERKVVLFGEPFDRTRFHAGKSMDIKFYVYRFITESNDEMMLLTTTKQEIGDYIIDGVVSYKNDYQSVSESAKIATKLPFLFARTIKGRIIKYKSHNELGRKLRELGITRQRHFDYPTTITKNYKSYKLIQPKWYKLFMWSWLTHQPKGIFNNYPLHIMQVGIKGSGKSLQVNSLHSKSKETRSVFSGSSSTLKHLVPSFKYNPARLGYLAESNRFAFCDEFLRCLINTKTSTEKQGREESVAMMNDLLEHQKRQAGSGISSVNVNMTARIFATTNPVRGMSSIEGMIDGLDESFLSRWLVYYQTEDHVQMIRDSNDEDLEEYKYNIDTNEWIAIWDYLHTFSAEYDKERVMKYFESLRSVLSLKAERHYDARHKHHIDCLMDGIIKSRCVLDNDMKFVAVEEDYNNLEKVWSAIIGSWINKDQVMHMELNRRIYFLPEIVQFVYWKLVSFKGEMKITDLKKQLRQDISSKEFDKSLNELKNFGIVIITAESIKPHYMDSAVILGDK